MNKFTLEDFHNSEMNEIFDGFVKLSVDSKIIKIDDNTKDEDIAKYFGREIICIQPCIYELESEIDDDPSGEADIHLVPGFLIELGIDLKDEELSETVDDEGAIN